MALQEPSNLRVLSERFPERTEHGPKQHDNVHNRNASVPGIGITGFCPRRSWQARLWRAGCRDRSRNLSTLTAAPRRRPLICGETASLMVLDIRGAAPGWTPRIIHERRRPSRHIFPDGRRRLPGDSRRLPGVARNPAGHPFPRTPNSLEADDASDNAKRDETQQDRGSQPRV